MAAASAEDEGSQPEPTPAGGAVCLLPGTELAFAAPVRCNGLWSMMVNCVKARMGCDMADAMLARFRQLDLDSLSSCPRPCGAPA